MVHLKTTSLNTGQSYIVGMNVIANIVRYLGKIEVMKANVMIADASWLKKDTIMHRC